MNTKEVECPICHKKHDLTQLKETKGDLFLCDECKKDGWINKQQLNFQFPQL